MRTIFPAVLTLFFAVPALYAQSFIPTPPPVIKTPADSTGFAKPYEFERQAYGYDPEGVEYRENQAEDFQVIFITAAPFAALASFALTGLASTLIQGSFGISGNYFYVFLGGTALGATGAACLSVLTNPYPPPDESPILAQATGGPRQLALSLPLLTAQF
jgi:hypothetical protein